MRPRRVGGQLAARVDVEMTPMIDVVFQLLTFFLMTFKVVEVEGDFRLKMPLAAKTGGPQVEFPPIRVALRADPQGNLAEIAWEGRGPVESLDRLHALVASVVVDNPLADEASVEFRCDPPLRYEHAIRAITAVSGGHQADGTPYRLIDNVRLGPPARPR